MLVSFAQGDRSQVESAQAVTVGDAQKSGPQVARKLGVIVEPPEGWRPKNDELGAELMKPVELSNCFDIISRWAPVFPILFNKGNHLPRTQREFWPLGLIDENAFRSLG